MWLRTARLPFLVLIPAVMLQELACVWVTHGRIDPVQAALVFVGALAALVSVNALNEYQDFRSGLDALTQRTPFSGGSGTLVEHPELAKATLLLSGVSLAVCASIGLYFLWRVGPALLPIGLLGLAVVLTYTRWLTRHPWICLIAPGLGVGPVTVLGTHVALTGEYSLCALAASVVTFFLLNNLLLLNQFPDVEADRHAGRRHVLIAVGPRVAARVYAAMTALAYVSLVASVWFGLLPRGALLALLTAGLALPAVHRVLKSAEDVPALLPAMRLNVALNVLTPALMGLGMLVI